MSNCKQLYKSIFVDNLSNCKHLAGAATTRGCKPTSRQNSKSCSICAPHMAGCKRYCCCCFFVLVVVVVFVVAAVDIVIIVVVENICFRCCPRRELSWVMPFGRLRATKERWLLSYRQTGESAKKTKRSGKRWMQWVGGEVDEKVLMISVFWGRDSFLGVDAQNTKTHLNMMYK